MKLNAYLYFCVLCALLNFGIVPFSRAQAPVELRWLQEHRPDNPVGVSWGVPWPEGKIQREQHFVLETKDGTSLPLQTWPLAYWPDGSLKWSGFATVPVAGNTPLQLKISKKDATLKNRVHITESAQNIRINTGALECVIPKSGEVLIDNLRVNGQTVGEKGKIECILQNGLDEVYTTSQKKLYHSAINKVTIEQNGPVRAVIRVQGSLKSEEHPLWSIKSHNTQEEFPYRKGKLLYSDNFDAGLENWVVETPPSPNSKVDIRGDKLVIDVDNGATVWFDKKLSGNILIEYKRKVIMDNGKNDRLSDLNQFWMASDPLNPDLFTRTGVFSEYDPVSLYYFGMGGNYNTTTRFRKYMGDGERKLFKDLEDEKFLLKPNEEYHIKITVYNGTTKVFVNDREYVSFTDPDPLQEGYFGFRTVKSRQEIDDFKVYRLE